MKKIIYLLLLCSHSMLAQVAMESDTVEIKPNYRPEVMKVEKLYSKPLPETAYIEPPTFKYEIVPRQLDSLSPRMGTYKAIALPKEKLSRLYGNFLKVGYGNFNTPFVQGSAMTLRNRDYTGGLNLNHYSNNSSNLSRRLAESEIEGYGKIYRGDNVYSLDTRYSLRNYRFYGFDELYKDSFNKDQTKLGYSTIDLAGTWQNGLGSTDSSKMKYGGGLDYYTLTDKFKNKEQAFVLTANLSTNLSKCPLTVKLVLDANGLKGDKELNRTFVKLTPTYLMGGAKMKLLMGASAVYLNSDADPVNPWRFIIFPKVHFSYFIDKYKLKIIAGMDGDWQKNTIRSLSLQNPFLVKNKTYDNTSFNQLFAGVSGSLGVHTFYVVQANFKSVKSMAFFMTEASDSTTRTESNLNAFLLAYDDCKVSNLHIELNHHVAEKIKFQLSGNLYKYTLTSYAYAWNLPTADLRLHGGYSLGEKLVLGADVYAMNRRYGNRFNNDSQQTITAIKLPGFVDFNLNADYRYSKQVSAFLNINNLTAARYQRWYKYPVAGFNVLAGLTIHF